MSRALGITDLRTWDLVRTPSSSLTLRAIEMAREFPHAEVVGYDLAPIQRYTDIPDNCHWVQGDFQRGISYPDGTLMSSITAPSPVTCSVVSSRRSVTGRPSSARRSDSSVPAAS